MQNHVITSTDNPAQTHKHTHRVYNVLLFMRSGALYGGNGIHNTHNTLFTVLYESVHMPKL